MAFNPRPITPIKAIALLIVFCEIAVVMEILGKMAMYAAQLLIWLTGFLI